MTLAVLSFPQEVFKSVVGAGATAVFVTVLGSAAATFWTGRFEHKRRDAEDARDENRRIAELARDAKSVSDDIRRALLERATTVAAAMFVACQDSRRRLKEVDSNMPNALDQREILDRLDASYLTFAVSQRALEAELGAHFGFRPIPVKAATTETPSGFVHGRWHQVADLLTVYYFNLRGEFRDDVLKRNSIDYEGGFHSGIELSPLERDPSQMRKEIRSHYEPAMKDLVASILAQPFAATPVAG
jgi:hypothetical protein